MTRHEIMGRLRSRRSVLRAVGSTAAAATVTGSVTGTQSTGYIVEQDDICQSIEPLSYRNATVDEFYGYTLDSDDGRPWSANPPVALVESDVSQLFLYEGPEGLSLVVLHDAPELGNTESGGAASLTFRGLPETGEWLVKDDPIDESLEEWDDRQGDRWTVHWSWRENYTDGGAFAPVGPDFRVEIEPAWGDDAELEPLTDGELKAWVVVSGDPEDPDRYELDMDRPAAISAGTCRDSPHRPTRRHSSPD